MRQRLRIGIAGAGIGGLTAAALLADRGHEITVIDQFERPMPVGSGLVIQPVGQAVLDEIGAGEVALGFGARITRMLGYEVDHGRPVLDVLYDRPGGSQFGLAIHRAALFDAISKAAFERTIDLVPDRRITGRNSAYLETGSTRHGPYDLIVDAAGAGSPLSPLKARALPYGAIWGTVPWPDTELPSDHLSQRYRRADRMIGALPIGCIPGDPTPKAAIFWSMPRDAHEAWRARGLTAWKDDATHLWPDFAPFLETLTDPDQMTMARYAHGTLKRPWGAGIVHIGDAAHRASPQLGQGANMALLDALALARALELHPLDQALRAYGLARRWHVGIYQAMSAAFTPQYQSDSRLQPWLRDRLLFPVSRIPPVPRGLGHLVRGTMLPPLGSLGRRGRPL